MANPTTIVILTDTEDEDTEVCEYTYLDDLDDQSVYMGDTEEEDPSEAEPMGEEDPPEVEPIEEEIPPIPVRPTIPTLSQHPSEPSFRPYRLPNGPVMMYTPRKRVHTVQPETIPTPTTAPTSPKHQPETIPTPARNQPNRWTKARRWDWLPHTLQEWRDEEGIPNQNEVGESSTAPHVPRLTQEPLHHTVPLLVVRAATQERRIHSMNQDMERLSERIEECAIQNTQSYWAAQNDFYAHDDVIGDLRERLEEYEERNAELEERLNALEQGENPDHSHT